MKGYRKISEGSLKGWPLMCEDDNSDLDNQIRTLVHGPIIDVMKSKNTSDFYVVVYKKVS